MKRSVLMVVILIAFASVMARYPAPTQNKPRNSSVKFVDTLYIDSTESKWTDVFWQDFGAQKILFIQADDTSEGNFGGDSAAVKIELYQAFPRYKNQKDVVLLQSRACPDSTSWPYSGEFVIDDSLDVLEMDTTCLYAFTAVADTLPTGDTVGYYYTTVIDSAVTDSAEYIACKHYLLTPDASPGIAFKVTGKASNKVAGSGTMWVLTVYQIDGEPVSVVKE